MTTQPPGDDEGLAAEKATAPDPDDPRKPQSPPKLKGGSWTFAFSKATNEFSKDQCTDLAAALTYYSVQSIFPAMIALVSLLGVFGQGQSTVTTLLDILRDLGATQAAETLKGPISSMVNSSGASIGLLVGVLGAIWSASAYVGAFGRAMNRIYEIDEGRPFWKLRPINYLLTVVLLVFAVAIMIGLVLSGSVAETIGSAIGLGSSVVAIWNIAKWPVILLLVVAMVALLYWGTPNVRQPKFRWLSVGAAIAILVAIVATALFGLYVSQFSSYNKTYGALAGVIVVLIWLWLINVSLLFGAEVDAEMERSRQLQAGMYAEETLQLPPRDTKASLKAAKKQEKMIRKGQKLREKSR